MQPGKRHVFKCGHSGIFPDHYGESNKFVYAKGKTHWFCRRCRLLRDQKYNSGTGPSGLLGRMRRLITMSKQNAKVDGHTPIKETPEELVSLWHSQKGLCAWTRRRISLSEAKLDHNHKTGSSRGFVTEFANRVEGFLSKMSFAERAMLFATLYPEETKIAASTL